MMSATHKFSHRRPLGTPVVQAIRVGIAASVATEFPYIDARLDRRLGIGRNVLFGPFVTACAGAHCYIPAALHLWQNAGVFQHFASGGLLKDTFAVHLGVIVEGARNQGNDKDTAQRPFTAAAFLFLRRSILFVLFLLCTALLLHVL